jgi:hypothetical protein
MDPTTEQILKPVKNLVYLDFEVIYGVIFPLYINDMIFDSEKSKVDIMISYHKKATFPCPCGTENLKVHSKIPRIWRALDIAKYKCFLHLDVPRVNCPKCGVKTFQVPWARDHSHLTTLMENNILTLASYIPVSNLAKFLGERDHRLLKLINSAGARPVKATRSTKITPPELTSNNPIKTNHIKKTTTEPDFEVDP